jgi:hypothetical protein
MVNNRSYQSGTCFNHPSNASGKRVDRKRLGDHRHAGIKKAVGDGGILGIAGHEEDIEVGAPLARRVGELPPI